MARKKWPALLLLAGSIIIITIVVTRQFSTTTSAAPHPDEAIRLSDSIQRANKLK